MPYTKGPWKRVEVVIGDGSRRHAIMGDGFTIGYVFALGESSLDDANLLTAAPELLAACEAMPDFDIESPDAADFKDHASEFVRAMKLSRIAIAKAKGGNAA